MDFTTNVTMNTMGVFTTPVAVLTADIPPAGIRGKQSVISSFTGTLTGVEANTIGKPFTVTWNGPANPRGTPTIAQSTGQPLAVPRNEHHLLVRKGVEVVTGYFYPSIIDCAFRIPAGSEIKDPESVRAQIAFFFAWGNANVSSIADAVINGTL